jgi:hypothetical protein
VLGKSSDLTWAQGTGANYIATFGLPDVLDGLVARWKMDEASWNGTPGEVVDSVSTNNGVAVGGAVTTNGLINRCGYFNGSSGWVKGPSISSVSQTNNNVTLTAWIKDTAGDGGLHGIHAPRNTVADGWVLMVYQNKLQFYTYGTLYIAGAISSNQWKFVTYTFNNTTNTLYIDGVQSYQWVANLDKSTSAFYSIGAWDNGSYRFMGLIDDARIYNRALSSNEVNVVYDRYRQP